MEYNSGAYAGVRRRVVMEIPKEIREKIEQRIQLTQELDEWFNNNLDVDGCDTRDVKIVDTPKGTPQLEGEEYCDQHLHGGAEDWWYGQYYWRMDNGKYLCMDFDV